jgi:hypothetical protein
LSDLTHEVFYEQNGLIAARVLRNGAANGSLIANLRRRHCLYGLRQQIVFLLDDYRK